MNLSGIIAISVIVILIGALVASFVFASIQSSTRHEPTFLKEEFAQREKEKGVSAAASIFWILLLFLTTVILVGL